MNDTQKTYRFHGQDLLLVEHLSVPHVAMKPVVEGIGLAWQGQREKLASQRAKFSCNDILTTGKDGKRYSMLCIPLSKLNLWLASINPNKIPNHSTREHVEAYQEECALALYEYWFHGGAINPRATDEQLAALQDKIAALENQVAKLSPKTPAGAPSAISGLPRNNFVRAYHRAPPTFKPSRFWQRSLFDN